METTTDQEQQKQLTGKRIRLQREANKLTQDMLAKKLNMKRTSIANYELGNVMPPGNIIKELSDIFGISADFLLGRVDLPLPFLKEGIPSEIYLRLARQAEEIEMPEEDIEFFFKMYRRFKIKSIQEKKLCRDFLSFLQEKYLMVDRVDRFGNYQVNVGDTPYLKLGYTSAIDYERVLTEFFGINSDEIENEEDKC
jgi:Predicted transcription factor, homolog of eukaryotic MBF1